MTMKAISIDAWYASAIVYHLKKVELRSRRTSYRGKILICSTKYRCNDPEVKDYFIFGHAIAVATLYDCRPYDESLRDLCFIDEDTDPSGLYCFMLKDVEPIKPIPVRGQQRIYNAPIEENEIELLGIDMDKYPDPLPVYWKENGYIKSYG